VYTSTAAQARLEQVKSASKPPLRALILGGDFFTGSVLAVTLTKLVLRYAESGESQASVNAMKAEVCDFILCVVLANHS
jgi:coatomer subunit beta